jgi:hypothetical protein
MAQPSNYQRVGSQYDVTEAGQADNYHLVFDGVDDFMVTPTVDFTGTDEMSVFAGVRKLSDAATTRLVELSANSDSNNGSFFIGAPSDTATNAYAVRSRGTLSGNASTPLANYPAPISNVVTLLGEISSDLCNMRIDGELFSGGGDQGTGNFGNYPLYIGSRAGTSLRFNGHIYSLITRGALTSGSLLSNTEYYVASKTAGVSLS